MFRTDLSAIFSESFAVTFQLRLSHVVTAVVVCTVIDIIIIRL